MAADVKFVQGLSTNFYVVDAETGARSFKEGFTPDAGTLYFLTDTKEMYKGSVLFASGDSAADVAALAARMTTAEGNITTLKGDKNTEGSVAYQIAQIVAGADTKYDTLKEIADWIMSDTTGAAKMASDIKQNADDIDALEGLVGTTEVATQISNAIGDLDADKKSADVESGKGVQVQVTEVDGKITAVALTGDYSKTYDALGAASTAETNAKTYADGLNTTMDGRVDALETTVGKEAEGETAATGLVKRVGDLEEAIGESGSVAGQIKTAIEALDATPSQTAGTDGLALSLTEVDGKVTAISGSIAANTYDAYGAASDEETRAKGVEGALTDLTTTAKNTLVAAINEVDANADAASTKVDTEIAKLDATVKSDDTVDGGIAVQVVETDGKITDVSVEADFSSYALKTYAESEADTAESNAKSYADGLLTWGTLA